MDAADNHTEFSHTHSAMVPVRVHPTVLPPLTIRRRRHKLVSVSIGATLAFFLVLTIVSIAVELLFGGGTTLWKELVLAHMTSFGYLLLFAIIGSGAWIFVVSVIRSLFAGLCSVPENLEELKKQAILC